MISGFNNNDNVSLKHKRFSSANQKFLSEGASHIITGLGPYAKVLC